MIGRGPVALSPAWGWRQLNPRLEQLPRSMSPDEGTLPLPRAPSVYDCSDHAQPWPWPDSLLKHSYVCSSCSAQENGLGFAALPFPSCDISRARHWGLPCHWWDQ